MSDCEAQGVLKELFHSEEGLGALCRALIPEDT